MKIDRVEVGVLAENCYVISIDNKCLVIDPGAEAEKIINLIADKEVLGILITNHNFDHVGALEEIKNKYKVDVLDYINASEKEYSIGPFDIEVIFNPGHTVDSISFYFKEENIMFVGDFIFYNSIGRCDLEGGNYQVMQNSIKKLCSINKDITLYPGHGTKTTLAYEKEHNPFFYDGVFIFFMVIFSYKIRSC